MIEDEMIPTADPEELIRQYEPLLWKLSGRYGRILEKLPDIDRDDLMQAGRMVIYRCQSEYDPSQASFLTFIYDRCRAAMRNVIGFKQDGSLPPVPASLDKPLPGTKMVLQCWTQSQIRTPARKKWSRMRQNGRRYPKPSGKLSSV